MNYSSCSIFPTLRWSCSLYFLESIRDWKSYPHSLMFGIPNQTLEVQNCFGRCFATDLCWWYCVSYHLFPLFQSDINMELSNGGWFYSKTNNNPSPNLCYPMRAIVESACKSIIVGCNHRSNLLRGLADFPLEKSCASRGWFPLSAEQSPTLRWRGPNRY